MTTLVAALLFALAADPTRDQSSTQNNSANRAAAQPPTETEQMAQVPGGRATPKSEWKTGDSRGKPRKPQAKRAKKQKHLAQPKRQSQ
jgi:hypothetical protein